MSREVKDALRTAYNHELSFLAGGVRSCSYIPLYTRSDHYAGKDRSSHVASLYNELQDRLIHDFVPNYFEQEHAKFEIWRTAGSLFIDFKSHLSGDFTTYRFTPNEDGAVNCEATTEGPRYVDRATGEVSSEMVTFRVADEFAVRALITANSFFDRSGY